MVALDHNPRGLHELAELVDLPLRLVHCVRNPYDNVASMTKADGRPLRVARYLRLTELMTTVKAAGWRTCDLHLEDLIADPGGQLAHLCRFLGLGLPADYVQACTAVLAEAPSETRHARHWSPEDLDTLEKLIDSTPWLNRYAGLLPCGLAG
jgi:hypothetical protein